MTNKRRDYWRNIARGLADAIDYFVADEGVIEADDGSTSLDQVAPRDEILLTVCSRLPEEKQG